MSVPVLSEHITVVHPSVSAAGNLFIRAFLSAIFVTPKANVMVNIAGRPSGIAATAKDVEARNASAAPNPNVNASMKLRTAIMRIAIIMNLVKSAIFRIRGVVIFRVSFISTAILPSSVCSPVATTTPLIEPRVINVPLKAIQR